MRISPILAPSLLTLGLFTSGLPAQRPVIEEVIIDELPGYYEFYMKAGRQETLRQERARDRQIEAGELRPVAVNRPLPPLSLPLPNGEQLDFADFKGKKNLVLVSYRSWW